MDRELRAGLTSRQSMRLGSLSPPGGPFSLLWATLLLLLLLLLLRSSSTRIWLELTMEGAGERGSEGDGESGWEGGGERDREGGVTRGGVGGSGRSRRRGMGGFLSPCCWQPFRISFRLGELSRLKIHTQAYSAGR